MASWHLQCSNNFGNHDLLKPSIKDMKPTTIKECSISKDYSKEFQAPAVDTTTQNVVVDGADITYIPHQIFESFPNVLNLRWTGGNLNELLEEYFKGGSKLKQLTITKSGLRKLDDCAFGSLVNLEILNLTNNELETITKNSFAGLENLQELILDGNKVNELNETIFNQLYELESIQLNQNEITKIPSNLFSNNRNLKNVAFQSNQIEIISPIIFKEKLKLEKVNLLDNVCINESYSLANEDDFADMKDKLIVCFINHPVHTLVHEKWLGYKQKIESLASMWSSFIVKLGNKVV